MRLLYVIDSLAPGGAETSLAEMAPGLVARGVDLHVLSLGPRLDLAARLGEGGAVVHRHDAAFGRIGHVRAVVDTMRAVRPTVVHTTLFEADVAGRTVARLRGVPTSTSLVNDSYSASHQAESNPMKLRAARLLDASTARFATRFHAISGAVADAVSPRLGIPRDKVLVIPRGRDPERFPFHDSEVRRSTRADLGLSADVPVVLAVGRLEPQKGLNHLLAALPRVAAAHPGVVVLIAGKDGRAGTALRAAAAGSGADIRFLGHRSDVPALLATADVLCFPSEREGFGGVLIEALAVGCPVVASSIPTTREVLGTGADCVGLLSEVGNPAGLGVALNAVLSDPGEAGLRADRGRQRFEEHFTIERVTEEMLAFFARVESDGSRARRRSGQ